MINHMETAGLAPRRGPFEAFPAVAQASRRSAELQAQDLAGRAYERHHEAAGERPYHRVREALQDHGGQSFRSVSGFSDGAVELRSMSRGGRTVSRRSSVYTAPQALTEQVQQ